MGKCLLSGKDFPPPPPTHHQGSKEEAGKILSTIGDLDMIEVKPGEKNLRIDAAQVGGTHGLLARTCRFGTIIKDT